VVVGACDGAPPDEITISEISCQDEAYSISYMVRLPHEPHSAERCVQIATRAIPRIVPSVQPFLSSPLRQTKEAAR
jgi:hypothetical protein